MAAYYNEIDPYAAQWLRNLIAAGHIAPGDVDERSINDVKADDLKNYTQCHFFAGIGVWSHALRLAGWPDDRPVWTGSCPCQPFSAAGKQQGTADERHLWPVWFSLIEKRRPAVVFGEQVEAAIRHGWLDLVQADLEGIGYAVAAAGIPAAGFGAPHIRQRLWFVADAADGRRKYEQHAQPTGVCRGSTASEEQVQQFGADSASLFQLADAEHAGHGRSQGAEAVTHCDEQNQRIPDGDCAAGRLGNNNKGLEGQRGGHQAEVGQREGAVRSVTSASESGGVVNAECKRELRGIEHGACSETAAQGRRTQDTGIDETRDTSAVGRPGPTNGHWRDADWLHCRDGKWRPVEPGTFPLAHGAAARVGRLRAYGNAIVPQVAAEVISAYMLG